MSELKRKRSGRDVKPRSSNSSSTTSRESLHDSPTSTFTASADDIRINGGRRSNGSSTGSQSKSQKRNKNSFMSQNASNNSSQSKSGNQQRMKSSAENLSGDSRNNNHQYNGSTAKTKQSNGPSMSHDRVRKIVQEEGRSARNLIAYNVPAGDNTNARPAASKPLPKSPKKRIVSGACRDMSPATKRDDSSSVRSNGSRPASSIGSQANRKTDMRARYWAFLFDNLKRAVDEIYQTCETDESVNECKEVIMILQQCTKDFQSLINQWNVIKTYENLEEAGQRPVALAWEVRKTSPGKLHLTTREQGSPSSNEPCVTEEYSGTRYDNSKNSWADLVKGTLTVKELEAQHFEQMELRRSELSPQPPSGEPPDGVVRPHVLKLEEADLSAAGDFEGWETVRRSRSKTSPTSKASTSSKGSICSTGTGKFQKPSKGGATNGSSSKGGVANSSNSKGGGANSNAKGGGTNNSNSKGANITCSKGGGANSTTSKKSVDNNGVTKGGKASGSNSKHGRAAQKQTEKRAKPAKENKSSPSASAESVCTSSYRDAVVKVSCDHTVSNSTTDRDEESVNRQPETARKLDMDGTSNVVDPPPLLSGLGDSGDGLLMLANTQDTGTGLKLNLSTAVQESEDEEVLAMELEQALGQEDEALSQQDAAIKSAIQVEQNYLLQLEETKLKEYRDDELDGTNSGLDSMETSATSMTWDLMMARQEADADRRKLLGLSWADMDESESRTPGRGAHMHEKLSSPSRKRSIVESKKRHEERQAKAAVLRDRFRQEKAEKVKDLTKKVEEVRSFKDKMEEQRRDYLDKKLLEAEEKRKMQLKLKVKKAHEEETKANEIAFINTLLEQNKKMDIMTKHKDVKARLMDIQEERQRKIDEKAAKEAAVEVRRKALDAERSARLAEMQLKRRRREEEIEHEKFERDKERTEALKAKEKEHRDRLAEIERQQQVNIEELQRRIEQKQSESTRRHNERLQNIREKAFIMNILKHSTEDQPEAPKLEPYNTKKMCTVCNMVIPSEVHLQSHLRGQQHQNMLKEKQTDSGGWSKNEIETFNIEHLQDVPGDFVDPKQVSSRERSKSLKKRCKKLKHRMQARGNEFEAGLDLRKETVDSQHKAKLNKIVKDVNKFMQAQEKGPWPPNKISALDRVLGEAVRILDKKVLKDQIAFRICGGLSTFTKLLQLLHEETVIQQYPKTCSNVCQALRLACKSCFENCHYFLFSNRTGTIIDLLVARLSWMVEETNSKADVMESAALGSTADSTTLANLMGSETVDICIDVVASALVHTLGVILSCLSTSNPQSKASSSQRPGLDAFNSRTSDTISFAITVGVVDKLQSLYTNVRGSLDTNDQLFSFLHHSICFLTAITKLTASQRQQDIFDSTKTDSTELMQMYEDIELAGIMSLLYGMLLHNVPTRGDVSTPPLLSSNTLTVTLVGLRLVNQLATMDLKLVQRVLGAEGVSLELRHIISYLIWYCTHHTDNEELLHEVVLCVGYFVVLHSDNQAIIQSGQSPTILQQLCSLPFQYFSDPKLVIILYPCLIASCYLSQSNRNILEQELSCDLLANFLEESQLQLQQKRLSAPVLRKSNSDGRMSLAVRFPEKLWSEAKDYFSSSADE